MAGRYHTVCLDCGYTKALNPHHVGITDAEMSAQRTRSGHLNKQGCERVVVLTESEAWFDRHGWWPARNVETYQAARQAHLEAQVRDLERRVAVAELALAGRIGGALAGRARWRKAAASL